MKRPLISVKGLHKVFPELSFRLRDGEYRVNFKGGPETSAYYTNDVLDAVNTARKMVEEGNTGGHHSFRVPSTKKTKCNPPRYYTCPECEANFHVAELSKEGELPPHKFMGKRCAGSGQKVAKENPPLSGSTGRALKSGKAGRVISLQVYEIRYRHAKDGHDYKHKMTSDDAVMIGLPDGSILLESASGKRLWNLFDV